MTDTIHRGDPKFKRLVIVLVICGIVIAALFTVEVLHWLQGLRKMANPSLVLAQLKFSIGAGAGGVAICFLALATYWAILGSRILREQRWPIANARILRDTPIRYGKSAQRKGATILLMALILLILAFVIPAQVWMLLATIH